MSSRPSAVPSLFNFSLEIGQTPWKVLWPNVNSGGLPPFIMTLFSNRVYQWELCGSVRFSQVAWVNSTIQILHTPAQFIQSQKTWTFCFFSISTVTSLHPLNYQSNQSNSYVYLIEVSQVNALRESMSGSHQLQLKPAVPDELPERVFGPI